MRAEEISRWATGHYPSRKYPAAVIGSSNGALIHLCAALGIPWLPQTSLVTLRRSDIGPDEPEREVEWGRKPARELLGSNPELTLHHMLDPNQDRLMSRRMSYFRLKRMRLGEVYGRFLEENLEVGATIFLSECGLTWPTTGVAERHVFQFGGLGGATPEEFLRGGERVEEYLRRYGVGQRRWEPPEPDGERPEAEWGFESALRDDVERFASESGYRVRRIVFEEPEHLGPLVADLYRWWYEKRGLPTDRLLIESFALMEPYRALLTGSTPFWTTFNTEPSVESVERYLDGTAPYDYIHLMLFSHGVHSIGLAPIERWRCILKKARKSGEFVGVDERRYPKDFATFVRYHSDLGKLPARYPMPEPLTPDQLDAFVSRMGGSYPVRWL